MIRQTVICANKKEQHTKPNPKRFLYLSESDVMANMVIPANSVK